MSEQTDVMKRLEVANRIAKSAGKITRKYFQSDSFSVEYKGDGSPLTIADQESETHLREQIEAEFPDDSIVGEEYGDKVGASDFGWILDPIDGTKSFISGVPLYGTMVAVEQKNAVDQGGQSVRKAIIGSVYFAGLEEGIFAARGHGAFWFQGSQSPVPAKVSHQDDISKSVLTTTCVPSFEIRNAHSKYQALANQFYFSRTWGDVYGYYLVATGRVEAMVDPELNVWDAAAVQPIIEEAGGMFTDWQGQPKIDSGDAIATNGKLHSQVLQALAE